MEFDSTAIWSAVQEHWRETETVQRPDLKVGFVLWPEFTLNAFGGFIDALRLASDVSDRSRQRRCTWKVMSVDGAPVRASCGVRVTPDASLSDPRAFDYVVVVSGLTSGIQSAPRRLEAYVADAAAKGVRVVGICTGGIVMARAGIMKGRPCCVSSFHVSDLESLETEARPVYDRIFVDDGDRITCAGGSSSIDLASYLVERHCGRDRVVKLNERLLVDRRRAATHAPSKNWLDLGEIHDPRARRAVLLMEQHLSKPLAMSELARRLNMSERHLERLFASSFERSPARVYRTMRLKFGEWMLANTNERVTRIALECGFSDSSHFSRLFQEEFGMSPTEHRRRALSAAAAAE